MGWIGQRQGDQGRFEAAVPDADAVMSSGTVMIEFAHQVSDQPINLLRYMARDPYPAALTLRVDPCGALRILVRCGARDAAYLMDMPAVLPGETVILRYGWDASGGVLAVTVAERDLHQVQVVPDIVPLTYGVARQMMQEPVCRVTPQVAYMAVSDAREPVGPMPGLDGAARVLTPQGMALLRDLRAGDMVLTRDGTPAQVRWAGAVSLPALGAYRPVRMRAPYYGARQDVSLQGQQMLYLSGSEVDYLFAESEVAVVARDLLDARAVMPGEAGGTVTYCHVMIDRGVPLMVDGLVVPGFDAAAMLRDPVLARFSALAGFPPELMPRAQGAMRPMLREFEAESLRRLRVA